MARRIFDDLSFEAPSSWLNASVINLVGTTSKVFQPSLVMTREEAPSVSAERHARGLVPEIARQVRKHRLVDQGATDIAQTQGYRLEHAFSSPEGVELRQTQIYFVLGDDLVVLALTCAAAEHAQLAPTLSKIAASLRPHPSPESPES